MEKVTPQQCKDVVREKGMTWLGHHRCGGCNAMVGWEFHPHPDGVHPSWYESLDIEKPDDVVVWFQSACDCGGGWRPAEPRSWSDFAGSFNMQTPEVRAKMWERFKAGKATHEAD